MNRGRAPAAALGAALILAAGGCGGDGGPRAPSAGPAGRPVTDAEALLLAQLLERNWRRGGARFTAEIAIEERPVRLQGRVDFRSGRGSALARPVGPGQGPPRRFFWTRRQVLAQSRPGIRRYDRQMPSPERDPIHHVIGFINLLSAETIDNTANIRDLGARFLRRASLAGDAVDVYAYGARPRTTLQVGREDGLLRAASIRGPFGPVTVTLHSHEAVAIALP